MAKTKGIVMKTSPKNTILYTEQGDYLKIKTPLTAAPLLGQVMEVDPPLRKAFSPSVLKIASVAAMLLLVLGVSVFNIVSKANTAAAAVIMDLNNSKELLVNSDAKVLKVIDINQAGQTLPSELKLRGKDIYTSAALMVEQAKTRGVFKQGHNLVMASIIPLDNSPADIVDQGKLRDSLRRFMLKENISADLMVGMTDETSQQTASNLGISVNNYLVYKQLMAKGLVVKLNGSGTDNTLYMLTEANTTLKSLFPQECITIKPQSETPKERPNSMETPMTGRNMSSKGSPASGSNQNPSAPNTLNSMPSAGNTTPNNTPMNSIPVPPAEMPKQRNMPATSGSGSNNMMR